MNRNCSDSANAQSDYPGICLKSEVILGIMSCCLFPDIDSDHHHDNSRSNDGSRRGDAATFTSRYGGAGDSYLRILPDQRLDDHHGGYMGIIIYGGGELVSRFYTPSASTYSRFPSSE